MGYFLSEEDIFWDIVKSTGTYDIETNKVFRHPLTFLLEAADDIAYATADIEDGLKKGFINYYDLLNELNLAGFTEGNLYYDRLLKYRLDATKNNYNKPDNYAASRWIISIQGLIIRDTIKRFIDNYEDIMNGKFKNELLSETEASNILKLLKNIARKYIFESKNNNKMELGANTMIQFLLDKFVKSVINYDTPYENDSLIDKKFRILLSDNQKQTYRIYAKKYENKMLNELNDRIKLEQLEGKQKDGLENEYKNKIYSYKLYLRLLIVTDYISGMTDTYMKSTYQELVGIK